MNDFMDWIVSPLKFTCLILTAPSTPTIWGCNKKVLCPIQEKNLPEFNHAGTLIWDFQPPELWENKFALFKPPSWWDFATAASDQIRSVTQSCPTLCDLMNRSTPGLLVHHQLPEFTQTHVHRVSDAIQPSHPLSSPSPLAPNPSQHQSLFQWVNSSHEVAKVLEFQL